MGYSYVSPNWLATLGSVLEAIQTSKGRIRSDTFAPKFTPSGSCFTLRLKKLPNFNPSPIGRIAGLVVVHLSGGYGVCNVVPPEKKWHHDLMTNDQQTDPTHPGWRTPVAFAKLCAMPGRQGPSLHGGRREKMSVVGGLLLYNWYISGTYVSGIYSQLAIYVSGV